jgi:DNA-binding XRE family transcriptional regulator
MSPASWHATAEGVSRSREGTVDDATDVGARVRRRRHGRGLSQDELARRADVSRQALGALEAGRHLPRVDAAIRLARALGTTVEELLAVGLPHAVHVLGAPVVGGPVRATRVADHTVVVPLPTPADGETFAPPDAVVRHGRVELLDGADLDGFLVVGCDPVLGVLSGLAPGRGPGRLVPVVASSAAARLALTTGRAHAGVVHDVAPPELRRPAAVHRLPLATWRTGLAAPADAAEALVAAATGRGTVVQRDPGAAAQTAYERALAAAGVHHLPEGPLATGHLDAARRATELGVAAVTIEPVAAALGLRFHPLETHAVELWIASDATDHPGARVVGELLTSARLRSRLTALPGYELGGVA